MNKVLTLLIFIIWACGNTNQAEKMDKVDEIQGESPITYLALGDSYTIGESVAEKERWPVLLADSLRKSGLDIADPVIIATTGWTTGELKQGIEERDLQEMFGLVSLLIGVNNQYRGYPLENYKTEFEELLQKAISFAGSNRDRVFVVSIPDYGVTPFGQGREPERIAVELDAFNLAAKQISEQYGVKYFNITDVSREALTDQALTAEDQLHPSGEMYRRWVEIIFPGVKAALKK